MSAAVASLLIFAALQAGTPQDTLADAVRAYQAALDCRNREERLARFRRAELLFLRLTEGSDGGDAQPVRNPDLYTNLGNAALGAERLGPAILAYRRALLLDPDHHRAGQNLRHARTLLPAWVPRPATGGLFDTFFAWRNRLSQHELQLAAASAFLIAALLLAAAIRWRSPNLRNLAIVPASIWLVLLLFLVARSTGDAHQDAVVIIPEVIARSADSAGAPPRLLEPLPGGTEVEVIEVRGSWTQVRLFDGRDAWLPTSALESIS
jgi:hypothetical protein